MEKIEILEAQISALIVLLKEISENVRSIEKKMYKMEQRLHPIRRAETLSKEDYD